MTAVYIVGAIVALGGGVGLVAAVSGELLSTDLASGLVIALTACVLVGVYIAEVRSRWRRDTASLQISARSLQADDELEQALAELDRQLRAEFEPQDVPQDERRDESLVLARLWASVNGRLGKYHNDAQEQGRRAFSAAMSATWAGFTLLVASGIAATTVQSTTGAIVAGALGGVSAAVGGYIARTFLRTYEGTSAHLRGYFLHPVEMSRYLTAERLIAQSGLSADVQAELMRVLVHSMVTGTLAETSESSASRPDGSEGRR